MSVCVYYQHLDRPRTGDYYSQQHGYYPHWRTEGAYPVKHFTPRAADEIWPDDRKEVAEFARDCVGSCYGDDDPRCQLMYDEVMTGGDSWYEFYKHEYHSSQDTFAARETTAKFITSELERPDPRRQVIYDRIMEDAAAYEFYRRQHGDLLETLLIASGRTIIEVRPEDKVDPRPKRPLGEVLADARAIVERVQGVIAREETASDGSEEAGSRTRVNKALYNACLEIQGQLSQECLNNSDFGDPTPAELWGR